VAAQHAGTTPPPTAGEEVAASPKIHELVTLLADPGVQKWLREEDDKKSNVEPGRNAGGDSISHYLIARIRAIRDHIAALCSTLPDLPDQFARGVGLLQAWRRVAVSQSNAKDTPPP